MQQTEYKFGVNYVPSKRWFYSWVKPSFDEIEEDICAISSLGVDHIRMHLRWDLFQPNETYVCKEMLDNLGRILDIVCKYGLKAEVAVFDGWMSGFWFMPSFVWNTNIITDQKQWEAQKYLLRALAKKIGTHPAFMGIDAGNEINVYDFLLKHFSVQEGDRWLASILGEIERLFPYKCNVVGVDHHPWFADEQFSRKALCHTGSMTSLHTWMGFTGATSYGVDSEECLCLPEFNIELANAYAEKPNRKVWIQEFGITEHWTKKSNFKKAIEQTMLNATRSDNLWGYTFWCSHDVSREYMFNDMEYDLGLFDTHNKLKPLGAIYKDCISAIKAGERPLPLESGEGVIINEDELFDGWKYGKIFADGVRAGKHIKFVLSSKSNDEQYLKQRNITRLLCVK